MKRLKLKLENVLKKSEFLNRLHQISTCNRSGNQITASPLISLTSGPTVKGPPCQKDSSSFLFDNIRPLNKKEIQTLKASGNRAEDWSRIYVSEEFVPLHIENNIFLGNCILGVFDGNLIKVNHEIEIPNGLYNNVIQDAEIGNQCVLSNVRFLSNYVILSNAILFDIGRIIASKSCSFGNGIVLTIGMKTSEREMYSCADLSMNIAEDIVLNMKNKELLESFRQFILSYVSLCSLSFGVVESNSIVSSTQKIIDTYFGSNCIIDNATLVKNCTILSSRDEPAKISDGAYLKDSCIQWGCEVTSMAMVTSSILTEHSNVSKNAKVSDSIIGPNTSISKGEVTSSFVGPFISLDHQALLVSALWPEGKGSVGYGANVGSGDTTIDQEMICGEGVLFGPGTNIKYPADLSKAPYTIIATGLTTLPQRMEFPFSLINAAQEIPLPPFINELIPGWVISNSIYFLMQNEVKYQSRNLARRNQFVFKVFRKEIIEKVVRAQTILENVKVKKDIYLIEDIPSIGKNYLTEQNRKEGIKAYQFAVMYYSLTGLFYQLQILINNGSIKKIDTLYQAVSDNPEWEYQRNLLESRGLISFSFKENLEKLVEVQKTIAQKTQHAKEKHEKHSKQIQKEYYSFHPATSEDPVIIEIWDKTRQIEADVTTLIKKIK